MESGKCYTTPILIVPNSIQLEIMQEATTMFYQSKHGLRKPMPSVYFQKQADTEERMHTETSLIISACGLVLGFSYCNSTNADINVKE